MVPVKINKKRYWTGATIAFLITVWYPITAFFVLSPSNALFYLKNDVTWSIYSLFLIPIGFGLLSSVFSLDIILRARPMMRWIFGMIFITGIVCIIFGTMDDAKGIPTPDRISSKEVNGINFQKEALLIDENLRNASNKTKIEEILAQLPDCYNQHKQKHSELQIHDIGLSHENLEKQYEKVKLKHAYYCKLLSLSSSVESIPRSAMVYISNVLNFIQILFIWCFVWISGIYFAYSRDDLGMPAFHVLIGIYLILITWFPLRAYSEWFQWYRDLSHIKYYQPFWVMALFAIALLLLFTIWAVTAHLQVSVLMTVPMVHSVLVAIIAAITVFKPAILGWFFGIFGNMSLALHSLTLCGLVFIASIYARALLRQNENE